MRIKKYTAKNFLNQKSRTILTATTIIAGISLSATVTQAGFQWVPPVGKTAAAPADDMSAAPAEAAPTAPVDNLVLPLPDEPIAAAPASQTLNLPSDYEAQPLAPPQPQQPKPVMQVRQVAPPAQEAYVPLPQSEENFAAEPTPLAPQAPVYEQPAPEAIVSAPEMSAPVTNTKVIMSEDAPQAAIDNTPNSQKISIQPYPGLQATTPIAQQPAAAPAAQQNFPLVEGFGSDMPLALALQQVAPPEYAFSFGQSVNPGQKVSWDGGKPWDQVISEMVAPLNLEAVISGRVVHIQQFGAQKQSALSTNQNIATADASAAVRRGNIKDPGEALQNPAPAMADIETAAGEAEKTSATAAKEIPAAQKITQEAPQENIVIAEIPPSETKPAAEPKTEKAAEAPKAAPDDSLPAQETASAEEDAKPLLPANQWQAKAGESLKEALTRWSEEAGVELIWMASYDYKIKQDIFISADFSNAVQTIVSNGIDQKNAPTVSLKKNDGASPASAIIIKDKALI